MIYLAFDIGCLECGEPSSVIGIFSTKQEAQNACDNARIEQKKNWRGEHSMEVFEIEI